MKNPNTNLYWELSRYLINECHKELHLIRKNWIWLSYAKKSKLGFKFTNNKDKQFEILTSIFKKASEKYKNLKPSLIAESLSEIVNTAPQQ